MNKNNDDLAWEVAEFFDADPGEEDQFRREYAGLRADRQGDDEVESGTADSTRTVTLKEAGGPTILFVDESDLSTAFYRAFPSSYGETFNGRLPENGIGYLTEAAQKAGLADLAGKLDQFRGALHGLALVLRPDGSTWKPTPVAKQSTQTGKFGSAMVTAAHDGDALATDVESFFAPRGGSK